VSASPALLNTGESIPLAPREALARGLWPWPEQTLLAPMEGITHPTLRAFMAEAGGVGVVCTEFVRITKAPLGNKLLRRHVVRPPGAALSVQVMGNELEQMADATELVTRAGADVVDINLGCPAPNAVRKGVGSAMLKDIALLERVLSAMRARTELPLSAKIRAGFDDASRVVEIAKAVQGAGADFITVHPRRRSDFYAGVADWRIIERLRRELNIPVVGNGDVWYAADALRMQRETGCHAVMIGRPAIRNPWIFRQLQALRAGHAPLAPTGSDLVGHLREFASRCSDSFGELGTVTQLKELVRFIGRAVPDGGVFQRSAFRELTAAGMLEVAERHLMHLPAEGLDLGAEGGRLERSGTTEAQDTSREPGPSAHSDPDFACSA
jgi:nifR3 family TIM-barrel protein